MKKLKLIQGKIPFYILVVPNSAHNFDWDINDATNEIVIWCNTFFYNEYMEIPTTFIHSDEFKILDKASKLSNEIIMGLIPNSFINDNSNLVNDNTFLNYLSSLGISISGDEDVLVINIM